MRVVILDVPEIWSASLISFCVEMLFEVHQLSKLVWCLEKSMDQQIEILNQIGLKIDLNDWCEDPNRCLFNRISLKLSWALLLAKARLMLVVILRDVLEKPVGPSMSFLQFLQDKIKTLKLIPLQIFLTTIHHLKGMLSLQNRILLKIAFKLLNPLCNHS